MQIDRVLYPVTTLGPGNRIGIWTLGCSKKCPKCVSPEFWQQQPGRDMSVSRLLNFVREIIKNNTVDGITISGGDPLEQAAEVLDFVSQINRDCRDILIYTGFMLRELRDTWAKPQMDMLVENTAVLIDGKYIDELNDNKSPLIGSTNQAIHYFNDDVISKYDEYKRLNGRQVQNIYNGSDLFSIGIHNKEG
jgi:anaerobic ribonucleoside-triphosphate reductase activating protein